MKINSNSGLISIDFLFGFLLSMAFIMVFFALAYSLTIVEVVQYVAFAASRTYMSADVDEATQHKNAEAKAETLVLAKFSSFLSKDWFTVGNGKTIMKVLAKDMSVNGAGNPEYFIGVEIPLTIKLLDFKIPFFGPTKQTDAGNGFQTTLGSYLIREPTQSECLKFNDNRGNLIFALPANFNPSITTGAYARISDNGC